MSHAPPLAEGLRLESGPECAYVVGPVAWETPLHVAHGARRVFWNDRDAGRTRVEAAPEEWLPVVLRVPRDEEGARRQRFEVEAVRPALREAGCDGLAPLLDRFPLPDGRAEALVLAPPPGRPLDAGPFATVLLDLFDLLRVLHGRGWTAGGLDGDDVRIDELGRWTFRPADRIAPAASPDDPRSDLVAWVALARRAPGAGPLADLVARVARERPPSADALAPRPPWYRRWRR
jgi:hypothetical protein